MIFFDKLKKKKKDTNKNELRNIIHRLSNVDLFFIRNEVYIELKKRGVFKCSK